MVKNRFISSVILILFLVSFTAYADYSSGNCGNSATYLMENDMLTISGTGAVDDDEGWIDYNKTITTVIINEGIEELGGRIFDGFETLTSVQLPQTLTTIGARTFRDCSSLGMIIIPDSVTTINANSFNGCDNLVIYCSEGSYAHEYAHTNGISYKILGNVVISFDANGGSDAPENISERMMNEVEIPFQKPVWDTYVFMGWSTDENSNEITYRIGDKFTANEDITLYAVWLKCDIAEKSTLKKVIINSNMTSPVLNLWIAAYKENNVVAVYNKELVLSEGENTAETGLNWKDLDKDSIKVFLWDKKMTPYASSENMSVVETYTVTFKDWDGTIISEQTVNEGENAVLPTQPQRDGYTFCGWSGNYTEITSDSDLSAQYIDSSKNNMFKVYSAQAKPDGTVSLSVYLGGQTETCGFDMNIVYDGTALEVLDIDTDFGLDIMENHIENESRIKFNYISTKNITATSKIMEIKFKIKNTAASEALVEIKPISVVKLDPLQGNIPVDTEYNIENGIVTIK